MDYDAKLVVTRKNVVRLKHRPTDTPASGNIGPQVDHARITRTSDNSQLGCRAYFGEGRVRQA